MNRKSWIYTTVLIISSLAVIFLASRGIVQSVINEGDVQLNVSAQEYQGDETITFHAALEFADLEQAVIEEIRLEFIDSSPIDLSVRMPSPLEEGNVTLDEDDGADALNLIEASIRFLDVTELNGTVPQTFKGMSQGARIEIDVDWNPDQDALAVAGEYTAMLSVRLDGSQEERQSSPANFSIVPVNLEIVAPQKVTPNTEFEAIVQADEARNIGNAFIKVLYDKAALDFADAQSDICSLAIDLNAPGEVTAELDCQPSVSGESLSLARLSFKTIPTIEPLEAHLELDAISLKNHEAGTIPAQSGESTLIIAPACGDLDGDGNRTISDADAMLKFITGEITLTANQMIVGNIDGITGVTIIDSVRLLQSIDGTQQAIGECND